MWDRLTRELDAWGEAGRRATLWCRDDDACRESPALGRLLGIARTARVPVTLAAVPAALEPSLVDAVAASEIATVVQHGFAHRNHAPPGSRKWELGAHRPLPAIVGELRDGFATLERHFGARFAPVLVPPWNRIATEVVRSLPDAGFRGLSTFGARPSVPVVPGLSQCNTHVDVIAWRSGRAFVGVDAALEGLLEHLMARRKGRVDASEPTGILTHHLDLDDAGWRFLADLAGRTREHAAADWIDCRAAFGLALGGPAPGVTSDRSA